MDWQRNLEAEDVMRTHGLGEFLMFWKRERVHEKFGIVTFTLNFDTLHDYWTCSFKTHGGRSKTYPVTLGAQPIVETSGTTYTFQSQHRAELAVRAALLRLRQGDMPA